jgi:hypothetical protein
MQLKTSLLQGTPYVEIVRIAEADPCDSIATGHSTAVRHRSVAEHPARTAHANRHPISVSNLLDW